MNLAIGSQVPQFILLVHHIGSEVLLQRLVLALYLPFSLRWNAMLSFYLILRK